MATDPKARGAIIISCEYPPFVGGIATFSDQLAREVRRAGFEALVIAPDYPALPTVPDPDIVRPLGHHKIGPAAALATAKQLGKWPAGYTLLAADIRSVLLVAALRALGGRPYKAAIHGSEVGKFGGASPLKPLVRQAYLGAQMISANSQATLDLFETSFGATPRGKVNYLGLGDEWRVPASGPFDHRYLAALDEATPVVCSLGRIEPRKGHAIALRALKIAKDHHGVTPVYVIAGSPEGPEIQEALTAQARELGVEVLFTGRISEADAPRLYRRAACHLLCAQPSPGKIEGFGLVLIEAGSQGCPSVTTLVGGIPEVLGETAGQAFAPADVDGMASAIAGYVRKRPDPDPIRANALRFTWTACAQGIFPELLGSLDPQFVSTETREDQNRCPPSL